MDSFLFLFLLGGAVVVDVDAGDADGLNRMTGAPACDKVRYATSSNANTTWVRRKAFKAQTQLWYISIKWWSRQVTMSVGDVGSKEVAAAWASVAQADGLRWHVEGSGLGEWVGR